MAELYQTTKQNISLHIQNIYDEGELSEDSVVKEYLTTAADGKKYRTKHYNLDMIISVGYRIKSHIATRFRQWATQRLREYIVKGFVLDDERLKNPDHPFDYFDELLQPPTSASGPLLTKDLKPEELLKRTGFIQKTQRSIFDELKQRKKPLSNDSFLPLHYCRGS